MSAKVPGSESSRAISLRGTKVPGREKARERKGQGVKVLGSELARVLLADSLQGANWPGSKKAVNLGARLHYSWQYPSSIWLIGLRHRYTYAFMHICTSVPIR